MAEKRLTSYELGQEFNALKSLIDEITDQERELSEDDDKFLKEETNRIGGDIKDKINGVCKMIKNLKMEADIIEAEKNALKEEMDRLSKRAKSRANIVSRVKSNVLGYLMDTIGLKKIKTELFSVNYQPTQKTVKPIEGFFNPDLIPVDFLDRAISSTKVKKAIEEGRLYEKYERYTEGEKKKNPLDKGKLFYRDKDGEQELKHVTYLGGEALYIR